VYQKLFEIALPFGRHITIYSYGVMMMVAFLAAIFLALARAKKEKIKEEVIWDVWTVALLAGLIGARLFYVVQFHEQFRNDPLGIVRIWEGGLVFYGGFLAALGAGIVYLWRKRVSIPKVMDTIAPSLMLGLGFGRIGCFLNGCCFGHITKMPWGVRFPRESFAWFHQLNEGRITEEASRSLPVHPTQIYSSIAAFLLTLVLLKFAPHKRHDGEVFLLLAILYSATRFTIEIFRADPPPTAWGLSISQILGIPIFILSFILFLYLRREKPSCAKAG